MLNWRELKLVCRVGVGFVCQLIVSAVTMDTQLPSKRFITASADDIELLRDGRHEKETKKSTLWGVKLFRGK